MDEVICVRLSLGKLISSLTVSRQERMETQKLQDSTEGSRNGEQLEFWDRNDFFKRFRASSGFP